ncbi:RNA polymerase sigma factor [Marinicauda salina]|uniref:RNA polymerase sigma factor n=1 Tax=Marinicauda salina TaxID=2135793 RepID=UPI001E302ED0|nr:RNA polymerase sigma factor [Marinicauda salina]
MRLIRGAKPEAPGGTDPLADESALARAIARGEPEAVRRIVDETLPMVLGLSRRVLGDSAEAEDAAQETFERVWRNAHRFDGSRGRLRSWIGRIAINHCRDRLRRRREIATDSVPDRADGAAPADARLAAMDGAARVRAAIAALPERQRLALELCHFQERSNIEAAEIMEVSVDALESLLARARRGLKAALAGEAGGLIADLEAGRGDAE